jgi:hypothetical protein
MTFDVKFFGRCFLVFVFKNVYKEYCILTVIEFFYDSEEELEFAAIKIAI